MKVGLYLQNRTNPFYAKEEFNKISVFCRNNNYDLLVCPEETISCFTDELLKINVWNAYINGTCEELFYPIASKIAYEVGCPIIFGTIDEANNNAKCIYSIYCNPFATATDTKFKIYIKHTATDLSPLSLDTYDKRIEEMFKPIKINGINIGITICYDSYHPLFSRAYGDVDLLVNLTGGHVDYYKWSDLQRARAIENNCYTLCTMSHYDNQKKNDSITLGYAPLGSKLESKIDYSYIRGFLYEYNFDPKNKDIEIQTDERLLQQRSINRFCHLNISKNILNSKPLCYIDEKLYLFQYGAQNIIIGIVKGNDLFKPEKVAKLLYALENSKIDKPRFIILNEWDHVNKEQYNCQILNLLRVRAVENYCAVMFSGGNNIECYQSTENKQAQRLYDISGNFGIDLSRCSGPNALWQNRKGMMRREWRENYELLLKYILENDAIKDKNKSMIKK